VRLLFAPVSQRFQQEFERSHFLAGMLYATPAFGPARNMYIVSKSDKESFFFDFEK